MLKKARFRAPLHRSTNRILALDLAWMHAYEDIMGAEMGRSERIAQSYDELCRRWLAVRIYTQGGE
jgi:hypothetical protein